MIFLKVTKKSYWSIRRWSFLKSDWFKLFYTKRRTNFVCWFNSPIVFVFLNFKFINDRSDGCFTFDQKQKFHCVRAVLCSEFNWLIQFNSPIVFVFLNFKFINDRSDGCFTFDQKQKFHCVRAVLCSEFNWLIQ